MGRLELSAYQDGQLKSLRVWQNPVGTLQHTVEDGSLMPIDPSGRMFFRVDAGTDVIETPLEAGDKLSNPMTYWQFVDISARITAEVPDDDRGTALASPKSLIPDSFAAIVELHP
jgi:hypothetical protein